MDAPLAAPTERVDRGKLWLGLTKFGLLPILLIAAVAFFAIFEPKFLRSYNIINIFRNASYLSIIAGGQMLVLIIGGFDLSVGAVVALTSVVIALSMGALTEIMPNQVLLVILIGCLAGLASGAAVGLANGLCVSLLKVSPFIVTLGTMSIALGLALYFTTGVPVYGMPDAFTRGFGPLRWFNIPVPVYIALAVIAALWWITNWTRAGRYIYAIGGNEKAARVSGINTIFYLCFAYTLCSLLASITGILLTARIGSGEATLGGTLMLESIAAAVIGGVALKGGIGRIELVALGALFLAVLTNGMNIIRVDSKIQTIVLGIAVIATVAVDQYVKRR